MLLEKLIAEQIRRQLRDREFSELLGIPRVTWTMTRLGHKPMGTRVARAAMAASMFVPEAVSFLLAGEAEIRAPGISLPSGATDVNRTVTNITDVTSTSPVGATK